MHPIVFPISNVTFPTTQTWKPGTERITKPCIKQSNQHFGTRLTPLNPKFAVHVTTNTEPNHIHDYKSLYHRSNSIRKKVMVVTQVHIEDECIIFQTSYIGLILK